MPEAKQRVFQVVDVDLDPCPFCTQPAELGLLTEGNLYVLRHWPNVACPARLEQVCAHQHEGEAQAVKFAQQLWNWQTKWGVEP